MVGKHLLKFKSTLQSMQAQIPPYEHPSHGGHASDIALLAGQQVQQRLRRHCIRARAIPSILYLSGHKRLGLLDDPIRPLDIVKHIGTNGPAIGPDRLQGGNYPNPARPLRLPAVFLALPVGRVDRDALENVDQALLVHDLGDRDACQELRSDTDILGRVRVIVPARGDGLVLDMISFSGDGTALFLRSD